MRKRVSAAVVICLFAGVLLLLGACGSDSSESQFGNESVNGEGICTSLFVSDYIRVEEAFSAIEGEETGLRNYQARQNLVLACQFFFESHDSVSCRAILDDKDVQLKTDDVQKWCE